MGGQPSRKLVHTLRAIPARHPPVHLSPVGRLPAANVALERTPRSGTRRARPLLQLCAFAFAPPLTAAAPLICCRHPLGCRRPRWARCRLPGGGSHRERSAASNAECRTVRAAGTAGAPSASVHRLSDIKALPLGKYDRFDRLDWRNQRRWTGIRQPAPHHRLPARAAGGGPPQPGGESRAQGRTQPSCSFAAVLLVTPASRKNGAAPYLPQEALLRDRVQQDARCEDARYTRRAISAAAPARRGRAAS